MGKTRKDDVETDNHNKNTGKFVCFPEGKSAAASGEVQACFADQQADSNSAQCFQTGKYAFDYPIDCTPSELFVVNA